MKRRVFRSTILLLAVALLTLAVLGCASQPEPAEETQPSAPATGEAPQPEPTTPQPEAARAPAEVQPAQPRPSGQPDPLADSEIAAVRSAIARAEEADAEYFAADLLKAARQDLGRAVQLRTSDPAEARKLLAAAAAAADEAYRVSVQKNAQALAERMKRLQEKLVAINAPEFLADEYGAAVAGIGETESLYRNNRLAEARDRAYRTLQEMSALHDRLSERLHWVDILKRDSSQYLNQAEKLQAHVRAPAEYERATRLYWQGVESFQKYLLVASEDELGRAREAALLAIQAAKSRELEEKQAVDDLMRQVMGEIEAASSLTVVTEDGTLIEPKPWSGEEYIREEPSTSPVPPSSMALPPAGETAVLGDVAEDNLLEQAKMLWQAGVAERGQGNYRLAAEHFQEAQRLVAVYKTQAVNEKTPIYVVRLIPERRDCLWRIAEYDFVYGNPYLWPQIWRRNRKLIQHPDLIHPGWKLIIPPR